jgi:hypothetical protein
MIDCPRCLGKGHVDMNDIKRLKKELFWGPGKCAYCNGIGKVPPDRIKKVSADFEYLTTDLSSIERYKIINNYEEALERAREYKEHVENFIEEIRALYYIENKEPDQIADYFTHKYGRLAFPQSKKTETIQYIDKVIKTKN